MSTMFFPRSSYEGYTKFRIILATYLNENVSLVCAGYTVYKHQSDQFHCCSFLVITLIIEM